MRITIKIISLLLFSVTLFGQSDEYVGNWKGNIELPNNGKLEVIFSIAGSPTAMTCTMNVPAQGGGDVPAEKIYLKDNMLHIDYPSLRANFVGKLSGGNIQGNWAQNGMEFPLNLSPYSGEAAVKRLQNPQPPFNYDITEIQMALATKNGQHELAGTLTTPKGDGPFPLAILVSGSGPQDRDETILGHKPFWVIADYLTKHGIAVLRYDDRGVGKSTGVFKGCTTEDFMNDALFLANSMGSNPKIDGEKVGIIGHSEGGLIAAMAAAKSKKVKFAILLAGPGVSGKQILKKQIGLMQAAEGVDEELIQREAQPMSDIIEIAAGDGSAKEKEAQARKRLSVFYENNLSAEEKENAGNFDAYFQMKTTGLFTKWMQYFLNVEPKVYLERISCPTLALIGSVDLQVPASDNIPALEASLKAAPTENYLVKEVPGVNHLFQHSKTGKASEYGILEETFANEVLVLMRDWIKAL